MNSMNTELMNKGFRTEAQREELTILIKKGITLVNSLIEANKDKDKDKEIIDYISENIDYNDMKATLMADYTRYVTKTLKLSKKTQSPKSTRKPRPMDTTLTL